MLFGADTPAPLDAVRLDGTTEATLVRSLSALPADERGWVTFAEARVLFSTRAHNTHSEKRTGTAEKTLNRLRRSIAPLSASCRSRVGSISYATAVTMAPDGHRSHSDQ
jgi:hypothetical protein